MAGQKSVFIVGAGFIGWNVLDLLLEKNYAVTALTRRKEHASQLEASGASTVMGSLSDHDLIAKNAASHDITIHAATADDMPSVVAILEGIKQRAEAGKQPIYIHTSGTSVLDDGSEGAYKSERIYSDRTRADLDSVPDKAPHRAIDLKIVATAQELGPKARIAIIIPPLIYGFNGAHGRLTIQIPTLTRFALKHGYAAHVGKGLSVESQVHVLDLARGYMVLLSYIESGGGSDGKALLENPYFFCENGKEFSWREVAENIGAELKKAGRIELAEPRELPKELYGDVFAEFTAPVAGLNSRSRAVRLRELGWEPKEKGLWESYREDELPLILKEDCSSFSGYGGTVAS